MRKILMTMISLVLLVITAGTVTFAWLSLATRNTVENLSLSAGTGNNLEMSIDGINFYSEIPNDLIAPIIRKVVLSHTTTMDGVRFANMDDILSSKNREYIALDFWVRSTDPKNHNVYLTNNVLQKKQEDFQNTPTDGTYIFSKGMFFSPMHDFLYRKPTPGDDGIMTTDQNGIFYGKDAARVAFIEKADNTNPLDLRTGGELQTRIIDLSENSERGYGELYGGFDYYDKTYPGVLIPPITKPDTKYSLTVFDQLNPYIAKDDNSKISQLVRSQELNENGQVFYKSMFTLNLWLEGWDADMFEAIKKDVLRVQFEFKLGREQI